MSTTIPLMVAVVAANQPQHAHIGPAMFQLVGTIAAIVFIPLYFKYQEGKESKRMDRSVKAKELKQKEKKIFNHPTENRSQDIPKVDHDMELKKDMAFYEALIKNSMNGRKP